MGGGTGVVGVPGVGLEQALMAPRIDPRQTPACVPPYLAYLAYLSGRARDKYDAGQDAEQGKGLGSMTAQR